MDGWLSELWKKSKNLYFQAIVLFLILLFALLGVISTVSDTGFSAEIQSQRDVLWIGSVVLAVIVAVIWLIVQIIRSSRNPFIQSSKDGIRYFVDSNKKAREIPDEDTFTYLIHVLGLSSTIKMRVMSEQTIAKMRGEKIEPLGDWERPLSGEEKLDKENKRLVRLALQKTDVQFTESTTPQKIIVHIANRGEVVIFINKINFQFYNLPQNALKSTYPTVGAGRVNIPIKQEITALSPGESMAIELVLEKKWKRSEIDSIRGHIGVLLIDAIRDGRLAAKIIIQL